MSKFWKSVLKYGITLGIGLGMVFLTLHNYGYSYLETAADRYKLLSDAFTIPGVVLICLGLLVWAANMDAFMGLKYVLTYAVRLFFPYGRFAKSESYYDYRTRMEARERKHGYAFLFVVGGALTAAAVVFMILFHQV